jgi:hypothetical protein
MLGILLASISRATASEWKPIGPQGTVVRSLAAAGSLLCAGTESKGVYCRDPQAVTGWAQTGLFGTTVTWLWIDPIDPRLRFAAAGQALSGPTLYRTQNGGMSWAGLTLPDSGRAWAVHGVPGSNRIVAAGSAVWISDDLGNHWTTTSTPGANDCVEIEPPSPLAIWSGGETLIFSGYTIRSQDGGATWETVWDSRLIGDNQTSDVSAHPLRAGVLLTGHEGFVLRTEDDGASFEEVLAAPSRFFLDWDGGNPNRAYAAGSPNGGTCHAFVSNDLGRTWLDVTGSVLAPRTVFRVEADDRRLGVVYAATDDGVYRFYGGGQLVCHDTRGGLDALRLGKGACLPSAPTLPLIGDVIALELERVVEGPLEVDLGEVECLVSGADVSLATLDTPDPAPGKVVAILSRAASASNYGSSTSGKPRMATLGDCP